MIDNRRPSPFQPATTPTGGRAAASRAPVRTALCATPPRGRASAPRGSSGATARRRVQPGTSGRAACRRASVAPEGHVTKRPESVCVGTDSPGPCEYAEIHQEFNRTKGYIEFCKRIN
ncbi:hypothetical protein EYF80_064074 [Liparis tanakae]|uniref:Uncharacterized protein n=1 Tax=Liparis tanakae TaxID=230148 RepID=A0A4Z2EB77_9TELE|nr:hypothetical protein EYF80_064074 [Liparis tanakae]